MRSWEVELNATCEVCGERYHICKKCIKLRNNGIDNWRLHCDKARCYQVLTVVNDYKNGILDKATAKEMLAKLGDVEVTDDIKAVISEIKAVAHRKKTEE